MAHALTLHGYTYAVSGMKETTFDIPAAKYRTWDFPDADAEVELLQNCKLYVGLNSGVTHLAAFLQIPSLVHMAGGFCSPFDSFMKWPTTKLMDLQYDGRASHLINKALEYLKGVK